MYCMESDSGIRSVFEICTKSIYLKWHFTTLGNRSGAGNLRSIIKRKINVYKITKAKLHSTVYWLLSSVCRINNSCGETVVKTQVKDGQTFCQRKPEQQQIGVLCFSVNWKLTKTLQLNQYLWSPTVWSSSFKFNQHSVVLDACVTYNLGSLRLSFPTCSRTIINLIVSSFPALDCIRLLDFNLLQVTIQFAAIYWERNTSFRCVFHRRDCSFTHWERGQVRLVLIINGEAECLFWNQL